MQVSPQEVSQAMNENRELRIIDVRTPAEYEEMHIAGTELVPLDKLDVSEVSKRHGSDGRLVVLCRSGSRSRQAAEKLRGAGCERVQVVDGGIVAWEQAGLPVVRGRKTISLERQVRIGAGSLVLLGVVLGLLVHAAFYGLSAFVGAGLVFAGVTDTCGMAMILAKMPWNQAGPSASKNVKPAGGNGQTAAGAQT